jgi:hypothetical protein
LVLQHSRVFTHLELLEDVRSFDHIELDRRPTSGLGGHGEPANETDEKRG